MNEERFGDWVRQRRKALDLTQFELAERVNYSLEMIKKVELHQRVPSKTLAQALLQELQIEPHQHGRFLALARNKDVSRSSDPINNLPIALTPIVDRKAELETITHLISNPDIRLLTITGPGGVGKTRLTYQLAQTLQLHFPDGVTFVSLESVLDANLLITAVAHALSLFVATETETRRQMIDLLRGKKALLILDNFEQILPATKEVMTWLNVLPLLKIIVTSRTRLNVLGEQEFMMPPMGLPDLSQLPEASQLITQSPAIDLFVQRVRAIRPDFELTDENGRVVAEICAQLDGIPLAIELAATRCKLFQPNELLTRLQQASALNLLTAGAKNLPPRQQTIRQTIDWSYNLLNEPEKALFAQLSVFADGATLNAIESVCCQGNPTFFDTLTTLVDHNLIWRNETSSPMSRFRMLGTLREYAYEKLESYGQLNIFQQKHAEYYADFVDEIIPDLHTQAQQKAINNLLIAQPNLRLALSWACTKPENSEIGLRLVARLWQFWAIHGDTQEGCRWIIRLLENSAGNEPSLHLAHALNGLGVLYDARSLPNRTWCSQAHALFYQFGDVYGEAWALNTWAQSLLPINLDEAIQLLHESVTLFRTQPIDSNLAWTLNNLMQAAIEMNDFDKAQQYHDESLAIFRQMGDMRGQAWTTFSYGKLLSRRGDFKQAQQVFEQSIAEFDTLNGIVLPSWIHFAAAWGAYGLGNLDEARQHFLAELRICKSSGDSWGTAVCLLGIAHILLNEGDAQQATLILGAAVALFRQSPRQPTSADIAWLDPLLESLRSKLGEKDYQNLRQTGIDTSEQIINGLYSNKIHGEIPK